MNNSMVRLILGASLLGFAPILVKAVKLGPAAVGAYRCGFAALTLAPLCLIQFFRNKEAGRPSDWNLSFLGMLTLTGFLFALDLFVWHKSVIYIGAGPGTLLGNTQAFYMALLGMLFFGEKPTLKFALALPLAFIGIYLVMGTGVPSWVQPDQYVPGILFGLLTGIAYATYLISFRRAEARARTSRPEQRLMVVSAVTSIFMFGIASADGERMIPEGTEWFWLFVLGFVVQVVGWWLISTQLPKVPVSVAGLVLLAQPIVALLMGAWAFGESLGPVQVVGSAITIFAIYLGVTRNAGPVVRLAKRS